MEFSFTDIFQHSPWGDALNSLKSLSLSGYSRPNYVRLEWEADDKEIRYPPTTHLIATVDDLTDMLDFDSEDIDGMDETPEKNRNHRPQGAGQPPHHMIYIWWTHPKKAMATRQRRITPLRNNLSADVSGAALSPAIEKIAIPAQETTALRMVPNTKTIPPSQASSKPDGRMGKLALMNRNGWRLGG